MPSEKPSPNPNPNPSQSSSTSPNPSPPQSPRERFTDRYASGSVPWDDPLPPPEVIAFAEETVAGRALDLGCGYGRAAIYLAERGWTVDGVDFVGEALAEAEERARLAGVADRTRFVEGSVTNLPRLSLSGQYDLVLDVGCLHRMGEDALADYCAGMVPLLAPGGSFLVFAHLCDPTADEGSDGRSWVDEQVLLRVLGDSLELLRFERGTTEVTGKPLRQSGWFWFRRPAPVADSPE